MGNGIAKEFDLMKDRIRSTHLHDNDGQGRFASVSDSRRLSIGAPTMTLLRSRAGQYPLLLELKAVAGHGASR